MKGVLAVKGNQERVIVQGVHMILNAAAGGPLERATSREPPRLYRPKPGSPSPRRGFDGCFS